jgi:hypothetical protein
LADAEFLCQALLSLGSRTAQVAQRHFFGNQFGSTRLDFRAAHRIQGKHLVL